MLVSKKSKICIKVLTSPTGWFIGCKTQDVLYDADIYIPQFTAFRHMGPTAYSSVLYWSLARVLVLTPEIETNETQMSLYPFCFYGGLI